MFEDVRVTCFLLMYATESPSRELADEGRHVSDFEQRGHAFHSELPVVGDGELKTTWHPLQNIVISFIVQALHQVLSEGQFLVLA